MKNITGTDIFFFCFSVKWKAQKQQNYFDYVSFRFHVYEGKISPNTENSFGREQKSQGGRVNWTCKTLMTVIMVLHEVHSCYRGPQDVTIPFLEHLSLSPQPLCVGSQQVFFLELRLSPELTLSCQLFCSADDHHHLQRHDTSVAMGLRPAD